MIDQVGTVVLSETNCELLHTSRGLQISHVLFDLCDLIGMIVAGNGDCLDNLGSCERAVLGEPCVYQAPHPPTGDVATIGLPAVQATAAVIEPCADRAVVRSRLDLVRHIGPSHRSQKITLVNMAVSAVIIPRRCGRLSRLACNCAPSAEVVRPRRDATGNVAVLRGIYNLVSHSNGPGRGRIVIEG